MERENMKTLIVDDSRMIRMVLRRIVKKLDHDIVEAGDGLQALTCLEQHGYFDLALIDWNMPNMNGLELLCAMRKNSQYDGTKIIMVTTEAEYDHMKLALESGANEYIMKPFNDEDVLQKLQMLNLDFDGAA